MSVESFDSLDVFRTADFDPAMVKRYDALMIGGSSNDPIDSLVWNLEDYPFIDKLFLLLEQTIEAKIPTLASCQGFHFVIQLLGGALAFDENKAETEGTEEIFLTL